MNWRTVFVSAIFALLPLSSTAVPIQWRSQRIDYVAVNKPVQEVLKDFAGTQGMAVAISPDIEGTVQGEFHLAPRQFLDILALTYGFVWYYNGAVLHIASAKGVRATLVKLDMARVDDLHDTLRQMRLEEDRFPITYDSKSNSALVVGPQEYVDVVRELASHLEGAARRNERSMIWIFPLRHTSAADFWSGGTLYPGIASKLQQLYGGTPAYQRIQVSPLFGPGPVGKTAPYLGSYNDAPPTGNPELRSSGAQGSPNLGTSRFKPAPDAAKAAPADDPAAPVPAAGQDSPLIVADESQNAILIRDVATRRREYAALIQQMDVPQEIVEIEVFVVDIERNALDRVLTEAFSSGDLWAPTRPVAVTQPCCDSGAPPKGPMWMPSGSSGANRKVISLFERVEQSGQATISSRPMIATLNHHTAVIEQIDTFYAKTSGRESGQVVGIDVGPSLKVTPHAAMDGNEANIQLEVNLTDGQISNQKFDGLPMVSRSNLSTKAVVRNGEGLLLGKHSKVTQEERVTRSGWLAKLPVVGSLFEERRSVNRDRERVILLFSKLAATDAFAWQPVMQNAPAQ